VQRTDRAYLGVGLRSLPVGGVLVVSVVKGGPAAKAGIRAGDVIEAIAGWPVGSVDELATVLSDQKPGDRVPVKVRRQDGTTATVTVPLGQLPAAGGTPTLDGGAARPTSRREGRSDSEH
jgi:S1-C subfamily serine protease